MKKVFIRLCLVASVGFIMTACHHDEKKTEDTVTTTDTNTVVVAPKPEGKEEKKEEPKEKEPKTEPEHPRHQDSLKVVKGTPVIVDTTLKEKPKDQSTVGGATKKHVKPGGIQGHSN